MNRADLESIMKSEPFLNTIGFGLSNCTKYNSREERQAALAKHRDALLREVDVCRKVAEWLKTNTQARATVSRDDGSYAWKHIVENEIGAYVSNGAFIAAAIYCGYKCKPSGGDNPNAYFNIRTYKPSRKKEMACI